MELADSISTEPYPGLRSFRKSESDIFFGRDDHLDEMTAKLAEHHFLCITGPSGCGKSSLARTGLMNHLEAGFLPGRGSDWIFCDFRPGDHPIEALFDAVAEALAAEMSSNDAGAEADRCEQLRQSLHYQVATQRRTSDLNKVLASTVRLTDRPIMILVDQFEELFRYAVSDSNMAVDFVEILVRSAAAKSAIYVVITIRTDELEKCSRYPELTHMINGSQFLAPVLDRYQIQHAIEGPIALFGGSISPEFSTWLLNSLEDELDRLPLMQHALKLLYSEKSSAKHRHDVTIGVDDFIRVFKLPADLDLSSPEGRRALRSSLSDRLTQRYSELPDRLKPGAQRVFCALTAIESQHRDIRRPQKLGILAKTIGESLEDTRTIVRAFSTGDEAYLRSTSKLEEDDTVDVTHECILRLWSQLQADWLVDEKRSADNITLLAKMAQDWEDSTKTSSFIKKFFVPDVLTGYTRDRYQKWFDQNRPNSTWAARYLRGVDWPAPGQPENRLSSEQIFARIEALLTASKQHRDRTRVAVAVAAAAPVLAVIAILWVYYDSEKAKAQIATMEARQARMNAQHAQYENDRIITSGLPPIQTRIANLTSAMNALSNRLAGYEGVWAGLQKIYELYRFNTTDNDTSGQVHAADFAPDGKSVLAIDLGGKLHQWALGPERKVLRRFVIGPRDASGRPAEGRSLRVSPLGDVAAVGFNDGSVVLVDLKSSGSRSGALQIDGAKPHRSSDPDVLPTVFGVVFSSDGSLLVTSSRAGNLTIWGRESRDEPGKMSGSDPLRWTLIKDVKLEEPQPDIWAVDIDRGKQTIALGLGDGRVCLLWLADLDKPTCSHEGHAKRLKSVKFKPDKPILVSAGNDAKVTIWNVDALTRQFHPWPIPLFQDNAIWDLDFNRDGSLLATSSWDSSVRIYQTAGWRLVNTVAADRFELMRGSRVVTERSEDVLSALRTVRFSPESNMLVTASLDHTARVWNPLFDRTSLLDLSYRLPPSGNASNRPLRSVAVGSTGDRIAFVDGDAVYLRSSGVEPKRLPSPEDGPRVLSVTRVLMPWPNEVVASGVEPRLVVWTEASGGKWHSRSIDLPGDAIPDGRGLAIDGARSVLAVEIREGEETSILLCPLPRTQGEWGCAKTAQSPSDRVPLAIDLKPEGCGYRAKMELVLSKSGRLLAAGSGFCPIRVFDRENRGKSRAYRVIDEFYLMSLDISPDEKTLVASSSTDQTPELRVWDLADGSSRNISHHFSPRITAARFAPSGQSVISTSHDNSIVVSSVQTGEKLIALSYRNSLLSLDIASTPRGVLMATGSDAGDINVLRFFDDAKDVTSYAESVLRDISRQN